MYLICNQDSRGEQKYNFALFTSKNNSGIYRSKIFFRATPLTFHKTIHGEYTPISHTQSPSIQNIKQNEKQQNKQRAPDSSRTVSTDWLINGKRRNSVPQEYEAASMEEDGITVPQEYEAAVYLNDWIVHRKDGRLHLQGTGELQQRTREQRGKMNGIESQRYIFLFRTISRDGLALTSSAGS